jgi:integrase
LIRWCHEKGLDFFELTDLDFTAFVSFLNDETIENAPDIKARSAGQVSKIAGTVMSFLAYIDTIMPGLDLIGPEGRVKAELKAVEVKKNGKRLNVKAWTHDCLARTKPARRRQPISTEAVEKLYDSNNTLEAPAFVVRRRFIMLRLFELTGARRIEISLIKIEDLLEAEQTGQLSIFSAKRRNDEARRYVPVTKSDLKEILSFVKHYRNVVIRRTIGTGKDHGYLFVSIESGKPLQIDTLSAELYTLRVAAGIDDEEACLHAFRHRYITNILRHLIRTHRCESVSDLKKALLSLESLKQQLMEWTGHSDLESLARYVHLAFEAESGFKETLDILQASKVVESLHFIIKDYRSQAQASGWTSQLFYEFENVVASAEQELSQLLASKKAKNATS